jgi:recombinase
VPEVGGAVDPGSEAHDLVMTLFGGMSKGERARIQMRVRTAMSALAQDTTRYLGDRPPYGYRLVEAGPHPNLAKANMGQRLHRLEPDPATAPTVERIYRMYTDGAGLRYIAQRLTDDGVPSPSQYDPVRNRHRDPRGWSHSAIRAILDNPTYRGVRYRCELGKSRSVPAELADHPPTVYLREDAVTPRLDEWIASLANPEDLAREQDSDLAATARHATLQRQLNDANRKVAALIEAVESGVAVADLTAALRRRTPSATS